MTGVTDPAGTSPRPVSAHVALAVVLQVRESALHVLLWERARQPYAGGWSLPGGYLRPDEDLITSIRRQLAAKVDVCELSHLEQLKTLSAPDRDPTGRVLATAYLGLVPADATPRLPPDTRWHPTGRLPGTAYDHGPIIAAGVTRLRAKLSYTNIGFALAPPTFTMSALAGYYGAALGYTVAPTNLRRILTRRDQIEATEQTATMGRTGGRPAVLFRFRSQQLDVTDPFAVLHPPKP